MHFTLHLPEARRAAGDAQPAGPPQRAERAGRRRDRLAAGRVADDAIARALAEVPRHRPPLHTCTARSPLAGGAACCWSTTTATIRASWRRCSPRRAAAGRTGAWWWRSSRIATRRTRDLFDDFAAVLSEVDALVLTEVYPAGEAPIAGADAKSLARAIRARGRIDPVLVEPARANCRRCCPTCCATATCCC